MAFLSKAASLLKFTVPRVDFPWFTKPAVSADSDATSVPGDDDNPHDTGSQKQDGYSQFPANKDGSLPKISNPSEKQMAFSKARKYVPTDTVLLPLLTWRAIVEDCERYWEDTGPERHCNVVLADPEGHTQVQESIEAAKEQAITVGSTPIKEDESRGSQVKFASVPDDFQIGDVPESTDKLTELGNEDGKGDASDLEKPADTLSNSYAGNGWNSVCGSPQPLLTPTEPSQNQDDIPIRRDLLTSEPLSKLGYGVCANTKDDASLQTSHEYPRIT